MTPKKGGTGSENIFKTSFCLQYLMLYCSLQRMNLQCNVSQLNRFKGFALQLQKCWDIWDILEQHKSFKPLFSQFWRISHKYSILAKIIKNFIFVRNVNDL